jgi:hypothetical protein
MDKVELRLSLSNRTFLTRDSKLKERFPQVTASALPTPPDVRPHSLRDRNTCMFSRGKTGLESDTWLAVDTSPTRYRRPESSRNIRSLVLRLSELLEPAAVFVGGLLLRLLQVFAQQIKTRWNAKIDHHHVGA